MRSECGIRQAFRHGICCHLFYTARHELDELVLDELPYIVFVRVNVP